MRKAIALPAIIAAGIARAERERRANVIARPMRNLMDMLRQGEVFELDGRAVMRMPEIDEQFATRAEWVEIAPAIRGWIDCWKRLAPDLRLYHMAVLAYYNINNMWWVVTGRYSYTNIANFELYAALPDNFRAKRNGKLRRRRLEGELSNAIKAMDFERAATIRDLIGKAKPAAKRDTAPTDDTPPVERFPKTLDMLETAA